MATGSESDPEERVRLRLGDARGDLLAGDMVRGDDEGD